MRSLAGRGTAVALLLLAPCEAGGAQRSPALQFSQVAARGVYPNDSATSGVEVVRRSPAANDSARVASPWAVLASAALPGSGQALLGQDRVIAYLAIEAYSWARYVADRREGKRARARYRNLASEVARRPFSDVRPVGDFEYYERMEKYAESGAFDAVAGGGLDPEPDTTTANGAIWLLARQTYWADPLSPPSPDSPEYRRAEAFYRERAVTAQYRWSWTDARLEYAEFRRTIRRSNNAFRNSLQDLGLVIANHALSTVDAFITVRLHRTGDGGLARYGVSASIPMGSGGRPRE